MISENLPRRTGLAANAGAGEGFEYRGIRASVVISDNLPRARRPGKGFEWTPEGKGRAQGARRQELGGRRDPHVEPLGYRATVRVAAPGLWWCTAKSAQKSTQLWRNFREGFDFWCHGTDFWKVSVGSRSSPACCYEG